MSALAFGDLLRLPVIGSYEAAFHKAMGVPLKLVPPEVPRQRFGFGSAENPFCALVAFSPGGCKACCDLQARLLRGVAQSLTAQQISCFAGLTDIAVPVVIGGSHVATLLSGQVSRREPTERDFLLVAAMLGKGQGGDWEKQARRAYFATPVVTADRFEGIIQLLNVFVRFLTDHAGRHAIGASTADPPAVASARRFVRDRVGQPVTLDQVVRHVGVSRFYFCKLFKRSTGMTFTDYVGRVRVEEAKTLLLDPSLRVSEVVYAAGFGSIPNFNSVFRRNVGMSPSEFRCRLRLPPAPGSAGPAAPCGWSTPIGNNRMPTGE